jgi:hypothetical protein
MALRADFSDRMIPAGTQGTVVKRYREPEGYAVDLELLDADLAGGVRFENLVLKPAQFRVVWPAADR